MPGFQGVPSNRLAVAAAFHLEATELSGIGQGTVAVGSGNVSPGLQNDSLNGLPQVSTLQQKTNSQL